MYKYGSGKSYKTESDNWVTVMGEFVSKTKCKYLRLGTTFRGTVD
jgi:hypothetical protein